MISVLRSQLPRFSQHSEDEKTLFRTFVLCSTILPAVDLEDIEKDFREFNKVYIEKESPQVFCLRPEKHSTEH